ncbi:Cytochrome c1 [Candidatus Methylobacter favarea]|uniref:Cytochrome c1 n=1 Tax=Candidatus Methylobacter favarea TaxID=2707345 RepID=A0A8S0XTR1_9GAMM|nr:cytochrome c1 [Candidatus Methylobacter favarea]CAA9891876.1 Cytochrome c1 [Candidatus Methylobacter favarea]
MKKIIPLFVLLALSSGIHASEGMELQQADIDLTDNASLQRGAKHFVTYCLGCHSIKHIRYLRIALDIGLDEKKMLKDIAPEGASIYDQMHTAMNAHDAERWFGIQPPDLSLIARSRSRDWIYSYLKGFYSDKTKQFGVNNTVFEAVSMPNPFWQLQGEQQPLYKTVDRQQVIDKLIIKQPGLLSGKEFDLLVNDLVNFLVYVGEPVQLERVHMGKYVLFYILMFLVLAYMLKKEYWQDVHSFQKRE